MDILNSATYQGGAQDTLGHLWSLLLAWLGLHVEQRQVDISLEVWTKPWLEICLLCCLRKLESVQELRLDMAYKASSLSPALRFLYTLEKVTKVPPSTKI